MLRDLTERAHHDSSLRLVEDRVIERTEPSPKRTSVHTELEERAVDNDSDANVAVEVYGAPSSIA